MVLGEPWLERRLGKWVKFRNQGVRGLTHVADTRSPCSLGGSRSLSSPEMAGLSPQEAVTKHLRELFRFFL